MENLPDELVQLIDRFKEHLEQYKGVSYDEANTRTDFIDPLFKLLGWDVANRNSYAEQYREVIREDKVSIEGGSKAPDYCFRIGGVRKFFVEAKKPSVDLRNDPSPAYQLRRWKPRQSQRTSHHPNRQPPRQPQGCLGRHGCPHLSHALEMIAGKGHTLDVLNWGANAHWHAVRGATSETVFVHWRTARANSLRCSSGHHCAMIEFIPATETEEAT